MLKVLSHRTPRGRSVSTLLIACWLGLTPTAFFGDVRGDDPQPPFGGRIQVIAGPSHSVPRSPQFVAIGDVDNDGLNDAVISCGFEGQVITAISDGQGAFATLITFPVGRRVGDLTLLHANGDSALDLAVLDLPLSGGGTFVSLGRGDGGFGLPTFLEGGRRAAAIVGADFDGREGVDIATANGGRVRFQLYDEDVTIFLSGQPRGYRDFSIGERTQPNDLDAADFDGDGDVDLVVLDTDPRNDVEIVYLPNDGDAQFLSSVNFSTGLGGVALVAKDMNDNGATDVVVANDDQANRAYSISVLLNRTRAGSGAGSVDFDILPAVPLTCPSAIDAIPVQCFISDVGAGDFNVDGLMDVVVSVDTRAGDDVGVVTPGFLVFYEGVGDGRLAFSTQINVGAGAAGLDVGDVTGDTIDDVVVTEMRDNTIRIVRPIFGVRGVGAPCRTDAQCPSTGSCVDATCCLTAECPEGSRCDVVRSEGICTPRAANGQRCTLAEQCRSGFCFDGFCCEQNECPGGQVCNSGSCQPPASDGPCHRDEHCDPPYCVDGRCCAQSECPAGQRCHIPGAEGVCQPALDLGVPCTEDSHCLAPHCTDGVCCQVFDCGPGRSCSVASRPGVCAHLPTLTPTPTPTPTPPFNTECYSRRSFPCLSGDECTSGHCVEGACCESECEPGERCDICGFIGHCHLPLVEGSVCALHTDCVSNHCDYFNPAGRICGPVRTPTLAPPSHTASPTMPIPTSTPSPTVHPMPAPSASSTVAIPTSTPTPAPADADGCQIPSRPRGGPASPALTLAVLALWRRRQRTLSDASGASGAGSGLDH